MKDTTLLGHWPAEIRLISKSKSGKALIYEPQHVGMVKLGAQIDRSNKKSSKIIIISINQ